MSFRDLPPVAENVPPRDKASQTLLARQAVCPRSAYLLLKHDGGVASHEMHRGSAFHEWAKRATLMLIERGEHMLPWEIGKDLMAEVVADHPEWVIPPDEDEALRIAATHWCQCTVIDPSSVVAVEKLFELPVGDMRVRGKVDVAFAVEGGVAVRDYKTSMNIPSQAEFEAKPQVPLYALLVGEGYPVREEECDECGGSGQVVYVTASPDAPSLRVRPGDSPPDPDGTKLSADECEGCDGSGRIETPEPPIGERFGMFDLAEQYPRLEPWQEGQATVLPYRQRFLSRRELVDQRLYVEGLVAKLEHGLSTGEWPAVPGSHCGTCAAAWECPIPAQLRDLNGSIQDRSTAEELAVQIVFDQKDLAARKRALKQYVEANGGYVKAGADLVFDFQEVEKEEWITGKRIGRPDSAAAREAMEAAIEEAVRFGTHFEYRDFRKVTHSTRFDKRKLTADEQLPEKLEESVSASERFGDDPPF